MPRIQFTPILKRFFPDLEPISLQAEGIEQLLELLEEKYPGLKDYLVDEQGELRQHVNIFVNNVLQRDIRTLNSPFQAEDEIFIMQALSGG